MIQEKTAEMDLPYPPDATGTSDHLSSCFGLDQAAFCRVSGTRRDEQVFPLLLGQDLEAESPQLCCPCQRRFAYERSLRKGN